MARKPDRKQPTGILLIDEITLPSRRMQRLALRLIKERIAPARRAQLTTSGLPAAR